MGDREVPGLHQLSGRCGDLPFLLEIALSALDEKIPSSSAACLPRGQYTEQQTGASPVQGEAPQGHLPNFGGAGSYCP